MQWLILGLALLLLIGGALILIGLYRRNIAKKKTGKEIKCSKCGRIIHTQKTSIADDIRRGGGAVVVIGDGGARLIHRCISAPFVKAVEAYFATVARGQALTHALNVVKVI